MPKAVWNGTVLAESRDTAVVEGNHYFPRESVRAEYLRPFDLPLEGNRELLPRRSKRPAQPRRSLVLP
jgi:Domain of unknown function (DUF427)